MRAAPIATVHDQACRRRAHVEPLAALILARGRRLAFHPVSEVVTDVVPVIEVRA